MNILHLSDTHFGTEQPEVIAALERHVQRHKADLLILSGDITQRARPKQFAAASQFLHRLKKMGIRNQLCVPGNHDIPLYNLIRRFFNPYGHYQTHINQELEPYFENDQALIIGLNTTHPKRHKNGRVTPEHIHQVCQRLQACPKHKVRIVVAHQPFGAMVHGDIKNLQRGARTALLAWSKAELDIVMGGHIHLSYIRPLSWQQPELSREIWTVQAGTTTSSRIRQGIPNAFNRLNIQVSSRQKSVRVEQWSFYQGDFVQEACTDLDWNNAENSPNLFDQ